MYIENVKKEKERGSIRVLHCDVKLTCFGYLQGDLHEFLVAHSPGCDGSVSGVGSDDGTASTLEQSDFLYIATQIAAGSLDNKLLRAVNPSSGKL